MYYVFISSYFQSTYVTEFEVSCQQHVTGSFSPHFANLCLLIDVVAPFTFKVINTLRLKSTILLFCFASSLFFYLLVFLWVTRTRLLRFHLDFLIAIACIFFYSFCSGCSAYYKNIHYLSLYICIKLLLLVLKSHLHIGSFISLTFSYYCLEYQTVV